MTDYPAKNRQPNTLPDLYIEVQVRPGIIQFDPNRFEAYCHLLGFKRYKPMLLHKSVISGLSSLIYRSGDLEIPLTVQELHRMGCLAMTPEQYFKLRDHFGMAFYWHEDFYDPETGVAVQPKGSTF